MKNKNGFIATSLIYTFFLAFIAILTALLSNYLANKTILDRYNTQIQDTLNYGMGSIVVYASYANIDNGKIITNLIRNGAFYDGLDGWEVQNGGNFQVIDFEKKCVVKTGSTGNLSQPVSIIPGHKYYFRMDYNQPSIGYTTDVLVSSTVNGDKPSINFDGFLQTTTTTNKWMMTSKIVTLDSNEALSYAIVGKQSAYNNYRTYYTNLLLMDITYSYEDKVSKEWLDEYMDYFEGTVSFVRKDFVTDEETSFTIVPYANYVLDEDASYCFDDGNFADYEISPITNESNTKYLLKVKEQNKNITCYVGFKHN